MTHPRQLPGLVVGIVALGLLAESPAHARKKADATGGAPVAAPASATTLPAGWMPTWCDQVSADGGAGLDPAVTTNCWTTHLGPMRANVILLQEDESVTSAQNMLYCEDGDYALCFFSGPPTAGGTNVDNPVLSCKLDKGQTTANCGCEAIRGGGYYVDIHAIGNLRVYQETIAACGREGERCFNMRTNPPIGKAQSTGAIDHKVAPVCNYVAAQSKGDPNGSLIPGADLISTYSFAMNADYASSGNTQCANPDHLPYAGCMTAGCTFPEGTPSDWGTGTMINCACPLWNGPYQIGQSGIGQEACQMPRTSADGQGSTYVWSAAYTSPILDLSKP